MEVGNLLEAIVEVVRRLVHELFHSLSDITEHLAEKAPEIIASVIRDLSKGDLPTRVTGAVTGLLKGVSEITTLTAYMVEDILAGAVRALKMENADLVQGISAAAEAAYTQTAKSTMALSERLEGICYGAIKGAAQSGTDQQMVIKSTMKGVSKAARQAGDDPGEVLKESAKCLVEAAAENNLDPGIASRSVLEAARGSAAEMGLSPKEAEKWAKTGIEEAQKA